MLFGLEDLWQVGIVFLAAVLAGAGNAVAGGGTNLSFPILVWAGLPPVEANATNAVGLSTGSMAAAWSYRVRIGEAEPRWWWLVVPGAVGGAVGAWLLLALPPEWFGAVAPFLVIGAALLVGAEPVLRRHIGIGGRDGTVTAVVTMLLVSFYGGYFGAGMGILILLVLSLLGMRDLHQANGFKNMLAVAIKGIAILIFIVQGRVIWGAAILLVAGSTVGGWLAGHLIQKVEQGTLRRVVVAMGLGMGVVMAARQYLL
jgi:uncharacterized protein